MGVHRRATADYFNIEAGGRRLSSCSAASFSGGAPGLDKEISRAIKSDASSKARV